MANETGHRPGNLKQSNKAHKHGRHRTKGEIYRDDHGRRGSTNVKTLTKNRSAAERQAVRRNQAKQARQLQREKVLEKKRQRGGQNTPPHFVVVIGLSGTADCKAVVDLLRKSVGETDGGLVTENEQEIVHFSIPRFKQRISMYIPSGCLRSMLDAAKVADTVLFVTSPDDVIDPQGDYCLKYLMGQGIAHWMFVCQGLNQVPPKKLADVKKNVSKELEKRIPSSETHVHPVDTEQEAMMLVYRMSEAKIKPIHFRENRPHMIAEDLSFEAESSEAAEGTLKISGYLRGTDLSADRLVHVTGWGTYQIAQIDSAHDPHPLVLRKEKTGKKSSMETEEETHILARPDPRLQFTLDPENEVDLMQEEQALSTDEPVADETEESKEKKKLLAKGISEYQAQWMFRDSLKDDKNADEDEDDDEDDEDEEDYEEAMEAGSDDDSFKTCSDEEDTGSVSMTVTDMPDEKYDVHFDLEAEKRLLQQRKEEREHTMFPDEVETPHDVPARERFAKYRGLASFRTSPWEVNEELPLDYKRIFRIGDVKAFKKQVMRAELSNSVTVGQYITVHIRGVPKAFMECYQPGSPMVMFGLLPFEQKMSVVHLSVKRDRTCSDTIKSKTRLTFQVGFRRFSACPIFSRHRRGDKFKMERYFPYEDTIIMSVYAPITFGNCPVLVFKENAFGEEHMVGSGSTHSLNTDRIILKRTILSGDMFKMGKKKSVVRFMFFSKEDILWFKQIELRTKLNRRGRILEPIGTHGHMKCHFNGQPKSQDVVLMYLYKRVFPKWSYQPEVPAPSPQAEEERGQAYEMFD